MAFQVTKASLALVETSKLVGESETRKKQYYYAINLGSLTQLTQREFLSHTQTVLICNAKKNFATKKIRCCAAYNSRGYCKYKSCINFIKG